MIEPGTYLATIADHGTKENNKGDTQVFVDFVFTLPNKGPQKITWYGGFKETSRPYTIKNLITCGLEGNNPAGPLKIGKQLEIVVDNWIDDKNRPRPSVRYINEPGSKPVSKKNIINPSLAKSKLADLEGYVLDERQKSGSPSDDEIPF